MTSASASNVAAPAVTTGRSARRIAAIRMLDDLYRHRSLVVALLGRQLTARYRGSALGFVWTFLNPLLLVAVYALVFRFYMRLAVPNYALFLLGGLLPWTWFAASLGDGTNAIVGGSSMVTKSMFPTEILPTVIILSNMINFLLSVPLLLVGGWFYGIDLHPILWICLVPVITLQFFFTLGLVLALAALNVYYRDVQHVVVNALMIWFFLTPIIYPHTQIPPLAQTFLWANPMALFMQIYHAVFIDMIWPDPVLFATLAVYTVFSLLIGARIFDGYRDTFPELV